MAKFPLITEIGPPSSTAVDAHKAQTPVKHREHWDKKISHVYRDGTRNVLIIGEGGISVASQIKKQTLLNDDVVDSELQDPNTFVALGDAVVEAINPQERAPDFVDKHWRYIEQIGMLPTRPKPKEGLGDNWIPKPYGKPFSYPTITNPEWVDKPTENYTECTDERDYPDTTDYWVNDFKTEGLSWSRTKPQLYHKYQKINLENILQDKKILTAIILATGDFAVMVTQDDKDLGEKIPFKYDSYNNYGTGTPVDRTTKMQDEHKKDYKLNKDKPKDIFVITYDNEKKEYKKDERFTLNDAIPKSDELLYTHFIDDTLFIYVVLKDETTEIYSTDLKDFFYNEDGGVEIVTELAHSITAIEVEDILTANRDIKEIKIQSENTGITSYQGVLQGFGRKYDDSHEIKIKGKRVIACHTDGEQLGLLVEEYESNELSTVDYPRRAYGIGLYTAAYPRVLFNGSVGGYVYVTDITYGGKASSGEFKYTYTRKTSYTRDIITITRDKNNIINIKLDSNQPSKLEPTDISITETSGYVEEGRPRHHHIDDGDSFTVYLASDFAGVDLGAVTDFTQDTVKIDVDIKKCHRIYACDPITDSYYVSTVDVISNVDYATHNGIYVNVFPEYQTLITNDKADITETNPKVKYRVFINDNQFQHFEDVPKTIKSFRTLRRFLGDPVDYKPITVPYNFFRCSEGSQPLSGVTIPWEYRTDKGEPLAKFKKNFSRNYANAGVLLAQDDEKMVISTNVDGFDLLKTTTVKSYADDGTGIQEQTTAQYAPVSIVQTS